MSDDCSYIRKPGCSGYGHMASGYWGRDIHKRILGEQISSKEKANLADQIKAGGIKAEMWIGSKSGDECRCYKKSNQQSERRCYSCYGKRYVPGFLKFGYNTVWMSASDNNINLNNTKVVSDFHSSKIILEDEATSGTIESEDINFNRVASGSSWEYESVTQDRIPNYSLSVTEYSLDSGSNWDSIDNLPIVNPAVGVIRFRVTLTRDTAEILSPIFEITRARFSIIDIQDVFGPWILLMRSIPIVQATKGEYGDLNIQNNTKVWTAGLSFFDSNIEIGSQEDLLEGHDVVFQIMEGARAGDRYVIKTWQGSDPFADIVVQQNFDVRYTDPVGPYSLIW